jgi:hypothetical protein
MAGSLTIRYILRGLLFWPEKSDHPDSLMLDGFQLELGLIDTYFDAKKRLDEDGWNVLTATLTAKDVYEHDLPKLDEVVERVCWLLSFAGGALIAVNVKQIDGGPASLPWKHISALGEIKKPFIPPIDLCEPGTARHWVQSSYGPYVAVEGEYRLRAVIHLLSLADAEHNLTIQALLVANTLEVLRYNFKKNVLKSKNTFKHTFVEMVHELKITHGWNPDAITAFRNKIVHEADIEGSSANEQHARIMEALHFCHVIVLALLEWDKAGGIYFPVISHRSPRKFVR